MHLWFIGTTLATFGSFQNSFGVKKSIAKYPAALEKLEGGPLTARTASGKSLRGTSVRLDLLPIPFIKVLVNKVIDDT